MGSRQRLPPSFPLFGQATTPDSSDDLQLSDVDDGFRRGQRLNTNATPPQFDLFPPLPNTGDIERRNQQYEEFANGGSAFTTPVMMGRMQQTYAMVDESTDTGNGHGQSSSPVISRGKNLEFMPFDPMDSTPPPKNAGVDEVEYSSEVDEEFLQNVVQEGELERLTKLAVEETEVAWKVEIMGELRKHVDGLAEDEWMYEY